jgi:hypothetical protein
MWPAVPGALYWGLVGGRKLVRFARTHEQRKRLAPVLIAAVLVCTVVLNVVAPPKASAFIGTGVATSCSNSMSTWDWPQYERYRNTDAWSPASAQYVILKTAVDPGHSPETTTIVGGYLPTSTYKLRWTKDATTGHNKLVTVQKSNNTVLDSINGDVLNDPSPLSSQKINDAPPAMANRAYGTVSYGGSSSQGYGSMGCVIASVNVEYDATYDGPRFVSTGLYTQGQASDGTSNCTALNFGCWIGKIGDSVTGAVDTIAQQITKGFAYLFAPNSSETKKSFDDLNGFMTGKLGFLVYPITFVANLFGAFTSGSSWCNSTSCSKSFGNFYGQPFNVNLTQMQTTMPTLWAFLLAALRGITVLVLIFGIRSKYMETMKK